jgi:hypothetical protein
VGLEVVVYLPGGNEDYIKQLVDLQVPRLGFVEDFADEVHRTLDGSGPPGGGGLAHPFPSVQAQGAPDPLRLAGAQNLGTP